MCGMVELIKFMTKTIFMRRGEVFKMFAEQGIKDWHVRTLIETGTIKTLKIPGREKSGRALFSREQIERDVLNKLKV